MVCCSLFIFALAWASVIPAIGVALLFIIFPISFPMLLAIVTPLTFDHLPLVPLPLYSLVMFPFSHFADISLFVLDVVWSQAFFSFKGVSPLVSPLFLFVSRTLNTKPYEHMWVKCMFWTPDTNHAPTYFAELYHTLLNYTTLFWTHNYIIWYCQCS